MAHVSVEVAPASDHDALRQLYLDWGYDGGIASADVVYVARLDGRAVGVIRQTDEQGVRMLRGMQVDPGYQRRGIGTRLLQAFTEALPAGECYCIPFAHLVDFYQQAGFSAIDEADAPVFLRQRLRQYRAQGHLVLIMRRPQCQGATIA